MDGFLGGYASERQELLDLVAELETTWRVFRSDGDRLGRPDGLISSELQAVRQQLAGRRLSIGIFGLIKRGKSTLLNAMIGYDISPVHVTPETAVPILVDDGPEPRAVAHLVDGGRLAVDTDDIARFTSQRTDSAHRDRAAWVQVEVPSTLLRQGVRLVDTPGLDDGEVDESYTERTLQQLDAVDAGVMVIMSPPTLGGTELRFIREVASKRDFVLACNMIPEHFNDPATRDTVVEYVQDRLADAAVRIRVVPVCAEDAVVARREGDEARWERSGVPELLWELDTGVVDVAAHRTLDRASAHLVQALRHARLEVLTEHALLSDPKQLESLRHEADERVHELRQHAGDAVVQRLRRLDPLPGQFRDLLFQRFYRGRLTVEAARSVDDLERALRQVRREVEVVTEMAAMQVRRHIDAALEQVRTDLDEDVAGVLGHVQVELRDSGAPVIDLTEEGQRLVDPVLGGAAAVGGLLGGVGLTAVGVALGPVGLLAGALVGWRLGSAVRGARTLAHAREVAVERIDDLVDAIARGFEHQLEEQRRAVRQAIERRYVALGTDLERQLDSVESSLADDDATAARSRQCEHLLERLDAALAQIGMTADEVAPAA